MANQNETDFTSRVEVSSANANSANSAKLNKRDFVRGCAFSGAAAFAGISPLQATAATAKGASLMRGVSLAGAEFGSKFPGLRGRDYIYPGEADFEFCASQGFNVVRLPFKWERLQPSLDAPFDTEEWKQIETAIELGKKFGQAVILDVHNYARRRVASDDFAVEHLIGSDEVPTSTFTALWAELARRTMNHDHVLFGIMNEPYDIDASVWLEIVNVTLAAIRETGARHVALVPGVAYTGAHSWMSSGNTALVGIKDPASNFVIEVHQYLDRDSSGQSGSAVSAEIGRERLQAFQTWARTHKFKAFLGEFGTGSSPESLAALAGLIDEVERNPDVWTGWAGWAAGPWWPDDDVLRLSASKAGVIPAQTKLLSRFARMAAQ